MQKRPKKYNKKLIPTPYVLSSREMMYMGLKECISINIKHWMNYFSLLLKVRTQTKIPYVDLESKYL